MKDSAPQAIFLKDYKQPDFWIPEVELHFDLNENATRVRSTLFVERGASAAKKAPLVLNGEEMKLLSVKIGGRLLAASDYQVTEKLLTVPSVPDKFQIEIEVEIEPHKNLA